MRKDSRMITERKRHNMCAFMLSIMAELGVQVKQFFLTSCTIHILNTYYLIYI
jgi:hypothetical protein